METCYKVMPRQVALSLDLQARGFEIEPEITGKLMRLGQRIYEVPISYAARSREEGKKLTATDGVKRGRRHPAFMGLEMVLDTEAEVEAEVVAKRKLTPELLVALMRRHAELAPDMGEVSEFHERSFHCGGEHRVSAEPTGARRFRHRGCSFSMPV